MKRIDKLTKIALLVFVGFCFTLFLYGQGNAKTHVQFSAGGISGSYYMIGAPTAKYVNEHSDMIKVTPTTSMGGVVNIRRVDQGIAEISLATTVDMYKGWNGIAPFEKKMTAFRTIGVATKILLDHTVTLAKYNIKNIEDVDNHIFAVGPPGSTAAASMLEFLGFTGLDKRVKIRMLPYKDYPVMLVDGKIHLFNSFGSIPAARVEQVGVQKKIAVVDFGPMLKKSGFLEKYPYYQKFVIPGGTYKGEERDVTCFGVAGYFIAGKDVPEDIVYEFTRIAYSEACIKSVTMAFKGHNLNRNAPLAGNIAPVHPGAAKFWKEIGLTVPEPSLK